MDEGGIVVFIRIAELNYNKLLLQCMLKFCGREI